MRRSNLRRRLFGYMKAFGMQLFSSDRLKSAQPHMQRDVRDLSPGLTASIQNLGSEMQSRRRRGHRAHFPREHCLIPLPILGRVRPLDVGR